MFVKHVCNYDKCYSLKNIANYDKLKITKVNMKLDKWENKAWFYTHTHKNGKLKTTNAFF